MNDVDPQEFGEMKATLAATMKSLEQHVEACYETNKAVATNLEKLTSNITRLTIGVVLLAALVLGVEGTEKILSLVL